MTLLGKIRNINRGILKLNDKLLARTLLSCDNEIFKFRNVKILNSSIEHILETNPLVQFDPLGRIKSRFLTFKAIKSNPIFFFNFYQSYQSHND